MSLNNCKCSPFNRTLMGVWDSEAKDVVLGSGGARRMATGRSISGEHGRAIYARICRRCTRGGQYGTEYRRAKCDDGSGMRFVCECGKSQPLHQDTMLRGAKSDYASRQPGPKQPAR